MNRYDDGDRDDRLFLCCASVFYASSAYAAAEALSAPVSVLIGISFASQEQSYRTRISMKFAGGTGLKTA